MGKLACVKMASSELASTYAALILADEGLEITAEKLSALISAANVEVESIWLSLLAKALEGKDVKELLTNVGAGGAAPAAGLPRLPVPPVRPSRRRRRRRPRRRRSPTTIWASVSSTKRMLRISFCLQSTILFFTKK